jgi:hypothetical protein
MSSASTPAVVLSSDQKDQKGTDEKVKPLEGDEITDDEKKALAELKEKHPAICEGRSDKWLLIFLFARKRDVKRTVELIEGYTKFRAERKLPDKIPMSSVSPKLLDSGYSFFPEGKFDAQGRPILYIIMRNFIPSDYSEEDQLRFMFCGFDRWADTLPLTSWRQGFVYVEDLAGVGMKNVKMGDNKLVMKAINGVFPFRIAAIYILNPGLFFRFLIKMAKWFMKAKIIKRVHVVDQAGLHEKVPKASLITQFGGDHQYTAADWARDMRKLSEDEKGGSEGDKKSDSVNVDDVGVQFHSDPEPSAPSKSSTTTPVVSPSSAKVVASTGAPGGA